MVPLTVHEYMAERGRRGTERGRKEKGGGKSRGDGGERSNVFSSLSMEDLQSIPSWGRGVGGRRRVERWVEGKSPGEGLTGWILGKEKRV